MKTINQAKKVILHSIVQKQCFVLYFSKSMQIVLTV